MKIFIKSSVSIFIFLASILCSQAEEVSREQMKGLDEQVQDIKKDVLAISADLNQLEEKLIYPSNSQVSIFVSLDKTIKSRLDAIKLKIDGKDVIHHIYTFKELEALKNGGIQRIFTGNARSGEHILEVATIVKNTDKTVVAKSTSYKFRKSVEPKLIEIDFSESGSENLSIGFKD